jgi:hypothetical protein
MNLLLSIKRPRLNGCLSCRAEAHRLYQIGRARLVRSRKVSGEGLMMRVLMTGSQTASIENHFVDPAKSTLDPAPDWSAELVAILRRTVERHIEIANFDDSSYLSRVSLRSCRELSYSRTGQRRISESCPGSRRILGPSADRSIQGQVLCSIHPAALQDQEARVAKKSVLSTQIATPNSLEPLLRCPWNFTPLAPLHPENQHEGANRSRPVRPRHGCARLSPHLEATPIYCREPNSLY